MMLAVALGLSMPRANAEPSSATQDRHATTQPSMRLTAQDEVFLDDLQRRSFRFFVDEADPVTGLIPDRARAAGGTDAPSSIAAVGFGLTALCIGESRGWISEADAIERCRRTMLFLRDKVPNEHGFYYHFIDMKTGERQWECELSSIDTALLMAGVLTVREHFASPTLKKIANDLFERVDWNWMRNAQGSLSMGWKPDGGFLPARWDGFNEGPILYLIAMGSASHPLSPDAWTSWDRQTTRVLYKGMTFFQCPPLFTHQFPQCWFDLRGLRDADADYFENSRLATLAQRKWCADDLSQRFPGYNANVWGITASDYAGGYTAWGGPPAAGPIDGTVVPCAPGGSLPFAPRECIDALTTMRETFGDQIYGKYGFADAFNPQTKWVAKDVLGLDVGVTFVMAENARTGFVWKTFMRSPEAARGLKAAGFRPRTPSDVLPPESSIFSDSAYAVTVRTPSRGGNSAK